MLYRSNTPVATEERRFAFQLGKYGHLLVKFDLSTKDGLIAATRHRGLVEQQKRDKRAAARRDAARRPATGSRLPPRLSRQATDEYTEDDQSDDDVTMKASFSALWYDPTATSDDNKRLTVTIDGGTKRCAVKKRFPEVLLFEETFDQDRNVDFTFDAYVMLPDATTVHRKNVIESFRLSGIIDGTDVWFTKHVDGMVARRLFEEAERHMARPPTKPPARAKEMRRMKQVSKKDGGGWRLM